MEGGRERVILAVLAWRGLDASQCKSGSSLSETERQYVFPGFKPKHPDDVDLWAAGLMEYPAGPGALVGPTFACILGRQFRSLKFADRFFYTHGPGNNVNALTDTQVAEISKFSLAKMICANADDPDTFWVQPQVFLQPDEQT
ncbi:chorion peroxidase [Ixodes scapularis]